MLNAILASLAITSSPSHNCGCSSRLSFGFAETKWKLGKIVLLQSTLLLPPYHGMEVDIHGQLRTKIDARYRHRKKNVIGQHFEGQVQSVCSRVYCNFCLLEKQLWSFFFHEYPIDCEIRIAFSVEIGWFVLHQTNHQQFYGRLM